MAWWQDTYKYAKLVMSLVAKTDRHETDIKALQAEVKSLTVAIQQMAFDRQRDSAFTRKRKVILAITGFAGVIVAVYLSGSSYSIYHPVPFSEPSLNRAAQWVQAHKDPARFGAVMLPPQFAPLSATGKAYVGDGGLVFFPSWMGRKTLFPDLLNSERDTIEGYGFSDKPLPTLESKADGSGDFFRMLDFSDPPHPAVLGANGPQIAVGRCLKPHWYEIDSFS